MLLGDVQGGRVELLDDRGLPAELAYDSGIVEREHAGEGMAALVRQGKKLFCQLCRLVRIAQVPQCQGIQDMSGGLRVVAVVKRA